MIQSQTTYAVITELHHGLRVSLDSYKEKIEKSRVVFLAGVHCKDTLSASSLYQIQSIFNQTVIENYWTPEDLLLVEDSWEKRKEELSFNQIKSMCFEKYKVEGWDDPLSCEQAMTHKKEWEKIESALLTVRVNRPFSLASLLEKYEILINFAKQQPEIESENILDLVSTRVQIYKSLGPDKNFLIQRNIFLKKCEASLRQIKKEFVLNTFDRRQQSLFDRISLCMEKTLGKVFVLLGPNHLEEQLLSKFKNISYITLDAEQLIKNYGVVL